MTCADWRFTHFVAGSHHNMKLNVTFGSVLTLAAAAAISFAPTAAAQPECATPHGAADGTPCANVAPGGGTTNEGPAASQGGTNPYIGGAGCIPGRVCNNGDD